MKAIWISSERHELGLDKKHGPTWVRKRPNSPRKKRKRAELKKEGKTRFGTSEGGEDTWQREKGKEGVHMQLGF